LYHTCLHCNRDLGTNESIEHFAVGRRIAFDSAQGRLWAVCKHCERWNLAPFDQRWEAVEECERAFSGTRVRVSTDNIGLARLREGTELVRIGKPLRPEFAAWRYGDQFGRRRNRSIAIGAGVTGAVTLGVAGLATAGVGLVGLGVAAHFLNVFAIVSAQASSKPIPNPHGGWLRPSSRPKLMQRPDVEEGWGIEIGYMELMDGPKSEGNFFGKQQQKMELGRLQLRGNEATGVLRTMLPRVNNTGASRKTVQDGVQLIEQAGDVRDFGKWAASQRSLWSSRQAIGDSGDFQYIPAPARLAFEMAMNENVERVALMGELSKLEAAWAEAERVAKIADGLQPARIDAGIEELKKRRR
jgi:hypothetical protein